ncbi:hypothetical protein K3495_g12669 [Podosphaera aphanis]|nr:hypothetical protein K3495_g12669 [Podosphaera aphanis]
MSEVSTLPRPSVMNCQFSRPPAGVMLARRYTTYKSPYGPKYTVQPNIAGFTIKQATRLGMTLGAFGGVAGFFALFFLGGVPRVKHDILEKIPGIGKYFVNEIPPSDNPF